MHSPFKEVTQLCSHGCCPTPLHHHQHHPTTSSSSTTTTTTTSSRKLFTIITTTSFFPNTLFTNHESLPSLKDSLSTFSTTFPQSARIDSIRAHDYHHLALTQRTPLDYIGIGLFSHLQLQSQLSNSDSNSGSEFPFFNIVYKSVRLKSQLLYGGAETEFERRCSNRIMEFLNVSDAEYSVVFTANKSSAFKVVAQTYPFATNGRLVTVYDHKSDAVDVMVTGSEKRGAKVSSVEFKWPRMRIRSAKLRKVLERKNKFKMTGPGLGPGLFVFPLQSRVTGTSYSYQWMSVAQENGWHVLLDACALGPKDMDSFGLSLIRPDFIVCSFYKVFGENPTGFGCLFVKKSIIPILDDTTNVGIATLVPANGDSSIEQDIEKLQTSEPSNQITIHGKQTQNSELEFRGLDHVDSLGLSQINTRTRCLINWLINAMTKLEHPNTETNTPLVAIYGPRIKFDRGPALAFNIYDWKGEKVEPVLVQKLADRSNISVSQACLDHVWFSEQYTEEKQRVKKGKGDQGITIVTVAITFLTSFEDVYRLWAFVARFLDADFVEKERWRYTALNQKTIEV